jgi:RES domain-containing protein
MPEFALGALRQVCWRILVPRWASQPLSGAGAAIQGGRYNRPGQDTLYLSLDLMTAVAEYHQDIVVRPGTFCAYRVDVEGILDLTAPDEIVAAGVTAADLRSDWRYQALVEGTDPPTWQLADRVQAAGGAGLLTPSLRQPDGVNLVLWQWNDGPERTVVAFDPEADLPQDQESWAPWRTR